MKKTIIYGLVDPRTDSLFYVGATANFDARAKRHLKRYYTSKSLRSALGELAEAGCGIEIQILDVVDFDRRDAEEYSWIIRCIDAGEPLVNRNVPMAERQYRRVSVG